MTQLNSDHLITIIDELTPQLEAREYYVALIETERKWEKSGSKAIDNGWRRYVERGVEFQADTLETAKRIAIGFAQFIEPDFIPECWEKINRHQYTSEQVQETFDDRGFVIHERRVKIRLVDLTEFEKKRQEQRRTITDAVQLSLYDKR